MDRQGESHMMFMWCDLPLARSGCLEQADGVMLLTISNPLITGRGAPLEALQRDLQVGLLVTFVIQDQHYYGIGVDSEFRGTCKSLTAAAGSHVREEPALQVSLRHHQGGLELLHQY